MSSYQPYAPSMRPPQSGTAWSAPAPPPYLWELASWPRRAAALLLDPALMLVPFLPLYVYALVTAQWGTGVGGSTTSSFTPGGAVAITVAFVWVFGSWIWNRMVRQGRTGQSLGKRAMRIRVVGAHTLVPTGVGLAFARELAHKFDEVLYLGFLWPLWDERRRTFADMLVSTVVVRDPR